MTSTEWALLALCPDCRSDLQLREGVLTCAGCGRRFRREKSAFSVLPLGHPGGGVESQGESVRSLFVNVVYARHNCSPNVTEGIRSVLAALDGGGIGLNLGSGSTRLDPRLVNFDLIAHKEVDLIGDAGCLPFRNGVFECVVSQEVFEHLEDPAKAAAEVARVLKTGGLFYAQVPFIIGYHSGPRDFWRFSQEGLRMLLEKVGLEVTELRAAVGAGTSLYRVAVEFTGAMAGSVSKKLYLPAKAGAALALSPFRWFDALAREQSDTNRISGGFFAIARKKAGR